MKRLNSKLRRGLAGFLAFCVTFTSFNMDAWAGVRSAVENENAIFLLSGEELRESAQEAINAGEVFDMETLGIGDEDKSLKKEYEKLFRGDSVYEFAPELDMDEKACADGAELRLFVRVPKDSGEGYLLTGDEEIIFLYVNSSDSRITFRSNIDGYLTQKVNVKANSESIDIPEEEIEEEVTEEPGGSAGEGGTEKPEETVKPEESVKPEETTKPAETVKPEDTTKPEETVKPEEATKPADTVKPEEATKPADTAKPDNGGNTGTEVKPDTKPDAKPETGAPSQNEGGHSKPESGTADSGKENTGGSGSDTGSADKPASDTGNSSSDKGSDSSSGVSSDKGSSSSSDSDKSSGSGSSSDSDKSSGGSSSSGSDKSSDSSSSSGSDKSSGSSSSSGSDKSSGGSSSSGSDKSSGSSSSSGSDKSSGSGSNSSSDKGDSGSSDSGSSDQASISRHVVPTVMTAAPAAGEEDKKEEPKATEAKETTEAETKAPEKETTEAETKAPVEETSAPETKAPVEETSAAETNPPVEETSAAETKAPVEETSAMETIAPAEETSAAETKAPAEETTGAETDAAETESAVTDESESAESEGNKGTTSGKTYGAVLLDEAYYARAYVTTFAQLHVEISVEGYSVSYSVEPVGTATVKGPAVVEENNTLTFTVTPQVGYVVGMVTANGEELAADEASAETGSKAVHYTISEVTEELEISVTTAETEEHPAFNESKTMNGVTVRVSAEEGILPAGTELKVVEVTQQLEAAVKEKVEAEAEAEQEPVEVTSVLAYDITLWNNGEELDNSWSENGYVSVEFSGSKIAENSKPADAIEVFCATKNNDDKLSAGNAKGMTAETLELAAEGRDAIDVADTKSTDSIKIDVEHFTVYAPVFYAQASSYKVTYDKNGGEGTVPDTQSYRNGATVTVSFEPIPAKEGKTFLGWSTSRDDDKPDYSKGGKTSFEMGKRTVTLYAVWADAPTKFFILLPKQGTPTSGADQGPDNYFPNNSDNGGIEGLNQGTGFIGGLVTYEGYQALQDNNNRDIFVQNGINEAYYTSPDDLGDFAGRNITWYVLKKQGDGYHIDGYLEDQAVTVYYYANYSGASPDYFKEPSEVYSGHFYKVLDYKDVRLPERRNYTFIGWNTKADGSGDSYSANESVKLANAIQLYAQWLKNDQIYYNIEHYLEKTDATGNKTYSNTPDSSDKVPGILNTLVTAGDKNFEGYEYDSSNNKNVQSGTVAKEPITLKRYYKAKDSKIKFITNGGSSIPDKTGVTDQIIADREIPSTIKSGFILEGWYGDNAFTQSTKITELPEKYPVGTKTYYAKWQEKTELVIGATSTTKTYNGNMQSAEEDSYTKTGLLSGHTLTGVKAVGSGREVKAGGYPVTIEGTAKIVDRSGKDVTDQYKISTTSGTLTIAPKDVFIVAESSEKFYGEKDPVFKGTVTGLVNNTDLNHVTFARDTNTPGSEDVGVHEGVIVPEYEVSPNYSVTVTPGNFEIKTASLAGASVTGIGNEWEYDGKAHEAGAKLDKAPEYTVYYQVEGSSDWSATPPSVTNVNEGMVTVFVKAERKGFETLYAKEPVTIKVKARAAAIKVNDAEKLFNEVDPGFTGEVTGRINEKDLGEVTYYREGTQEGVGPYNGVLKANYNKNPNYDVTVTPGNFRIKPITDPEVELKIAGGSWTYDGTEHKVSMAAGNKVSALLKGYTIEYSIDGGNSWTKTEPGVKHVSDKTITVIARGTKTGYEDLESNEVTIQITPRPVTLTVANAEKFFGDEDPGFTGSFGQNEIVKGDTINVTEYKRTNKGEDGAEEVKLYEKVLGASYESNEDYNISVVKGNFEIKAASMPGAKLTAEGGESTYDGQSHEVSAKLESAEGYKIYYKVGDTDWTTEVPSVTNVSEGTKVVSVKAEKPGYVTLMVKSPVSIKVIPKGITITVDNKSKDFDAADPTFTGSDPTNDLVASDDLGTISFVRRNQDEAVGTYDNVLDAEFTLNSNYSVTVERGTFVINEATLAGAGIKAEDGTWTYDGVSHAAKAELVSADEYVLYYKTAKSDWSTTLPEVTNVSEGVVRVSLEARRTGYKTLTGGDVTIQITPRTATITVKNESKAFDAEDPAFTGTVGGLVKGENSDELGLITYLRTDNSETVGTYIGVLDAKYTQNPNYTVEVIKGNFTIELAVIEGASLTAEGGTWEYDGKTHVADAKVIGARGFTVYYNTGGTEWTTTSPSVINVLDGEINVSVKATREGYVDLTAEDIKLSVIPKPVTINVDDKTKDFGGLDPEFTGTVDPLINPKDLGEKISYIRADKIQGVEEAGVYTDSIVPAYVANPNYTVTEKRGAFTIRAIARKTPLEVKSYNEPYNKVFNTITVNGLLDGDRVEYSLDGITWSSEPYTYKDVISNKTVWAKVTNANYTPAEEILSGTVTITRIPVTVKAENKEMTYGGLEPTLTAKVEGVLEDDTDSAGKPVEILYTVDREEGSDVKEGGYKIMPAGAVEQGNYTVSYDAGTLTIKKAKHPAIEVAGSYSVYNPDDHGVTVTKTLKDDTIWYRIAGSQWTTEASLYRYTDVTPVEGIRVFVKATNPNYEDTAEASALVRIIPKKITITANPDSKVFGEADPNPFTATVTGAFDNDIPDLVYTVGRAGAGSDEAAKEYKDAIVPKGAEVQVRGNYNVTYKPANFTILPANRGNIEVESYEGTYDGGFHTITVSGQQAGDEVTYSTDGGSTWVSEAELPTYKDVTKEGPISIEVKVFNPNYGADVRMTGTVSIDYKDVTITAQDNEKNYGDTEPNSLEADVAGTIGTDTVKYTVGRAPGEAAGSYAITPASATDSDYQGNYHLKYVPGTFTIVQAAMYPAITVTGGESEYDGQKHSVTVSNLQTEGINTVEYRSPGGQWSTVKPEFTNVMFAGDVVSAQTVEVRVSNPNYAQPAFGEADVMITQKEVTVTALNMSKDYDTEDPITFATSVLGILSAEVSSNPVKFDISRESGEAVKEGGYTITPTGEASQGNYSVVYNEGVFTINKAERSRNLIVENYEHEYDAGEHNVTVSGMLAGDTVLYSINGTDWKTEEEFKKFKNVTAAQTVIVKATNKNYEDAPVQTGTVTITPKTVIVQANSIPDVVYGDEVPLLTADVSETYDNDVIEYQLTRVEGINAGSYTITPSGKKDQGNYSVEFETGTLTINQAQLVVTAADASRPFGTDEVAYDYTVEGLKAEDTKESLAVELGVIYTSNADTTSDVGGNYVITPSGKDVIMNYTVTYVPGKLTVTENEKLALTTATEVYKGTYDGESHKLITFIEANVDNATILYKQPDGKWGSDIPTGIDADYYSVPVRLEAPNYTPQEFTLEPVIFKARLTVSAVNKTRKFMEANPEFTYTVDKFLGTDSSENVDLAVVMEADADINSPIGENYSISIKGNYSTKNYDVGYLPGTLTITPSNAISVESIGYNAEYDSAQHGLVSSVKLTPEVEGTKITYKQQDGSFSDKMPEGKDAGTYEVVVRVEAPNYDTVEVPVTATISKASLTVTAENASRPYGNENPKFDYSLSGLKKNDTKNSLAAELDVKLGTTATKESEVDAYPITADGAKEIRNYNVSHNPGTLTIIKGKRRPLVVQGFSGIYMAIERSVKVSKDSLMPGDEVSYSSDGSTWDKESPVYVDVTEKKKIQVKVTNKNYEDASETAEITIKPAKITVTADSFTQEYGETDPTELTAAITGDFYGRDTGKIAYTVSRIEGNNAGTYAITPSGEKEQSNYLVTYAPGTLTIDKAKLVVTAADASRPYGTDEAAYDYTVNGLKADDTKESLADELEVTYTSDAGITSNAGGDYVITPEGAADITNYTVTYAPGKLTVTESETLSLKAPAEVYAGIYDGASHELITSIEANADNATILYRQPDGSWGSDIPTGTDAGDYSVEVRVEAPNYKPIEFTLDTAIGKAKLTVSAVNKTRKYKEVNPEFTYKIDGFKGDDTSRDVELAVVMNSDADINSPAGETYEIGISGKAATKNYDVDYVPGALTVTASGAMNVESSGYNAEYDGVQHGLVSSVTPDVEGAKVTYKQPDGSFSDKMPEEKDAGTYEIVVRVEAPNYDTVEITVTATIGKAPLTVQAENAERKVGEGNPTFDYKVAGLKTGDTKENLASELVVKLTTDAAADSLAGNYAILADGNAELKNYTVTYVQGTLLVKASDNGGGSSGGNNGGGGNSGGSIGGGGTATGPGRSGEDTVIIEPEAVPLASLPPTPADGSLITIDDGEVPLAALPKTGESSTAGEKMLLLFAGMMMAVYATLSSKKRKED